MREVVACQKPVEKRSISKNKDGKFKVSPVKDNAKSKIVQKIL